MGKKIQRLFSLMTSLQILTEIQIEKKSPGYKLLTFSSSLSQHPTSSRLPGWYIKQIEITFYINSDT